MTKTFVQNKKFLILLFIFSFLIRITFFYFYLGKNNHFFTYDTQAYQDVATQIYYGNGISNLNGKPSFYRVPGYSLFLAACYKLFSNIDIKKVLWIQIFFASFIPLLIFLLSLVLFPKNVLLAQITSIFTSLFHLGFILFSGFAMSETFFILFWLLFLIFFLPQIFKDINHKNIFVAGIFLGIASLFRPIGHYLVLISILLILFMKSSFLIRIKTSALLFTGWLVIVFGWLLRNYLLTGFIFFHTLPGIHFLKHSASRIAMHIYGCSYELACQKVFSNESIKMKNLDEELGRELTDIEVCKIQEDIFKEYVFKDLWTTFKLSISNMFKTCFSLYSAELLYMDSKGKLPEYNIKRNWKNAFLRFLIPNVSNKFLIPIIYLEILLFLFILIGFLGFILQSFFIKDDMYLFLIIFPFIILFVVITVACGFARLRLPIEPFLIILSFKFWLQWKKGKTVGDL